MPLHHPVPVQPCHPRGVQGLDLNGHVKAGCRFATAIKLAGPQGLEVFLAQAGHALPGQNPLAFLGQDELLVRHQGPRGDHHALVGLHDPAVVKNAAKIQDPAQKR